jgi:CubicO group peptidase (beta-lactamase class C family)
LLQALDGHETVHRYPKEHSMRQLILAIFLIGVAACTEETAPQANAKPESPVPVLTEGTPEQVGMSSGRLAAAVDMFRQSVNDGRVTGAQLLVARQGKIVLHEALGWRDLEHQLPMEQSTLVRMASNTKSVVAVGVLILVDEGQLSLDDRVADILPGFADGLSVALTVRDLLRHTTGFENQINNYVGEVTTESDEFPDAPSLRVEAIKIGRVGPVELPGGPFQYNNWGYTVLGAILEEVTGQKVDQFLTDRIYVPFGMRETSHALYGVDESRVSINYMKDSGEWEVLPPEAPPFVRTTGGLVSTAGDFAAFCQMFLNGGRYGEAQVLLAATANEATSLQSAGPYQYLTPEGTEAARLVPSWYVLRDSRALDLDIGYGYGWAIGRNGAYSHGGFRGTFAYIDPGEDLIVLIFAQSRGGGTPGQAFIEAVHDAIQ